MTVKKRVVTSIESFIDKGADVKGAKEKEFKNVLVRIPIEILSELDSIIERKPWTNRTQWIVDAIYEKIMITNEKDFMATKPNPSSPL